MKKRLLFVIPSLVGGGAERSLVTLLQLIDYSRYDIDLFLFEQSGLFFDLLPENVRLLEYGEKYSAFRLPLSASVKAFLSKHDYIMALNRIGFAAFARVPIGTCLRRDQKAWKCLKPCFESIFNEYDAAIGYLEGKANYLVTECVKAGIKIGYIHNDYTKLGLDAEADKSFFAPMDYLVTVSPECAESLKKVFPSFSERVRVIENITSPKMISKLSVGRAPMFDGSDCVKLLTVGRMAEQKGCDYAVEAASILQQKGIDFKWYWIGIGSMSEQIEKQITESGLNEHFVLLCEQKNPYPYIKNCDIYVQPSRYEGKSIAIDEAKCLLKPIVATDFSTVHDQLENEKTALISEMSSESIAETLSRLISDPELRSKLSRNLSEEHLGNEDEIQKFYELIG